MNVDGLIRKCRHCNEPAGTTGRCVKHNEAHKADARKRLAHRKAVGLCACGDKPAEGFNRCQPCRDKQKNKQAKLREDGVCMRCAHELAVGAGMCRRCWLKKIAGDSLRVRGAGPLAVMVDALDLIWAKQGGKCAMSGEPLYPGLNASLDHILPQSRGGDHSIANLQWVTFHVNLAKSSLTPQEFILLCEQVVSKSKES